MLYFRYLKKDQNHIFTSHYQILYLRQLALHTTSSRLKGASEKTRPRTKEFHQAIHPRPTLSPLFRPVYRHRLRRAVKRHPERRYTAKKEYEKSGNGSGRITRTANRRRDIRHLLSDRQVWPETRRERIPAGLRRPGTTGFARACRPSPATAEGLETAVVTPRGEVRRRRVRRTAHDSSRREAFSDSGSHRRKYPPSPYFVRRCSAKRANCPSRSSSGACSNPYCTVRRNVVSQSITRSASATIRP